MSDYLKAEEIAEIYGISLQTVWRWCKRGRIKAKRIGKRWFIEKDKENLDESKNI